MVMSERAGRRRPLSLIMGVCCAVASVAYQLPDRAEGGVFWEWRYGREGYRIGEARVWDAPIDHLSATTGGTYRQRWFVDDTFFDEDKGLVFLDIGGEGTVRGPPGGYIRELGKKYGALLVSLEHRFYGESIPNNDMSTANLRLLTVDQALADIATFSDHLMYSVYRMPHMRFFTFGGSYPGALSAWYRIKFPHQTMGSLSSSGVVNAILSFPEFDQQVAAAIGDECVSRLRATTEAFERGLETNGDYVKGLFGLDEAMWDADFFYMIADSAAMADQYGRKRVLCQALIEPYETDDSPSDKALMLAFRDFTTKYWGPKFASSCFYDTRCLGDAERATRNERSWRWQKCHELAYFQVAPDTNALRSRQVDLKYHIAQCHMIFGGEPAAPDKVIIPDTRAVNHEFGGASPKGTRIFFSDFSDDPWQQASVREDNSPDLPYSLVTCDGCGHCMDLHQPNATDPEALVAMRKRFESYLEVWLIEDGRTPEPDAAV